MHSHFRQWLAVLLLSLLSFSAHATRYEIATTADTVAADGQCSLREALEAVNTRTAVQECAAGSGNDRIMLEPGETYVLGGSLEVGGGTDENGDPVEPSVRIELTDDTNNGDNNAVIDAAGSNDRAFYINPESRLILEGITVANGDASALATPHGGLIFSDGELVLEGQSRLLSGMAVRGGLIHATGRVEVKDKVRLEGGTASGDGGAVFMSGDSVLRFEGSLMEANESQGSGGAVALDVSFDGLVLIADSYLGKNSAAGTGGALFLQGQLVEFISSNTSFLQNTATTGAGAMEISNATAQTLLMNNVTIADSSSGSASIDIENGNSDDRILNTVIVGDRNGSDCAAGSALNDADDTTIFLGWSVVGPGCNLAGDSNQDATAGGTQNAINVLANELGHCGNADNTADPGCDLADLDPFPGYLPAINQPSTPFGNGNPLEQAVNSCQTEDQREISRLENECDSGSIEYLPARGKTDEFDIVWGTTTLLDVVGNDQGDSPVDCSRQAVTDNPLTAVLPDHQAGDPLVDDCIQLLITPDRATASVVFEVDAQGRPRARYSPGALFHGLDRFAYRVNRHAFDVTREGAPVEAATNVVSEPASGLTESDSIEHHFSGGLSGVPLLVLCLLGFVRRCGVRFRMVLTLLLLAAFPAAHAVEINVTSLADNRDAGDGFCTFREALHSSVDETFNPEPACEDGQDGRDTIILPRGCITMDASLGSFSVDGSVTIRGQGPHGVDASVGLDGSECSPNDDGNANWTEGTIIRAAETPSTAGFRIFDASSSMRLEDVSLYYGQALEDGDGNPLNGGGIRASAGLDLERVEFYRNETRGRGGALYLVGNSGTRSQQATLRNVYFLDNSADGDGGGVAMAAAHYDLEVNRTTFESNTAGETGGGMTMAMTKGNAAIVNTTLTGNQAGAGTGGLDMQEVIRDPAADNPSTPDVNIINTTVVRNSGTTTGGIDLGPDQSNSGDDFIRNFAISNSVVAANTDNACSSAGTPETFREAVYSLFSDDADAMATCVANTEDSLAYEDDAAIDNALAGATSPNVAADEELFVPPNLFVDDAQPGAAWMINQGNPAELAVGTSNRFQCRREDKRGLIRTSGGRCDIGAFELQETTAQDDNDEKALTDGSQVFIDVLNNDSTDPVQGFEIDPLSIDRFNVASLPSGDVPGTALVYKQFRSVECGTQVPEDLLNSSAGEDFDENDYECVVLYDALRPDPLDENSGPNNVACADFPIEFDEANPAFQYQFEAVNGSGGTELSNTADVTVVLENAAPEIRSREVWNKQGETKVIRLEARDKFGGELDFSTLAIDDQPTFAAMDDDGEVLGVGIKLNEPAEGYITYVPGDVTKTFRDRFTLTIEDTCGDKSTPGRITIRYPQEDTAGGELLTGGSPGTWVLWGFIGLGMLRRRLRAPARRRR